MNRPTKKRIRSTTIYSKFSPFLELAGQLQSIRKIKESGNEIHIYCKSLIHISVCPRCDEISSNLHATYRRSIQSIPLHGKYTCLHITAYKFNCLNPCCPQKVFMEPLLFAEPSQVRTSALTDLILALAVFLSDDGVSRVLAQAGARVSNDTVRRITLSTFLRLPDFKKQKFNFLLPDLSRQIEMWLLQGKKIRLTSRSQILTYAEAIRGLIPECLLIRHQKTPFFFFLEKMAPLFLTEQKARFSFDL